MLYGNNIIAGGFGLRQLRKWRWQKDLQFRAGSLNGIHPHPLFNPRFMIASLPRWGSPVCCRRHGPGHQRSLEQNVIKAEHVRLHGFLVGAGDLDRQRILALVEVERAQVHLVHGRGLNVV